VSEEGNMILRGKCIGRLGVMIAAVFFLGACAGGKLKLERIPTSENPSGQVDQLAKAIDTAKQEQVDVLSPTWFSKAEQSLNKAREGLNRGKSISKILLEVSYGKAQLQRAEEMAQVARTALPDVIKAHDRAITTGAPAIGRDYAKAEEQFLELTRAIENNDLEWAQKNRLRVTKSFDRLELQAIKNKALGEPRKLIAQAEADGARKIAPKTLTEAQDKLADADAFISKHRYEKEKIQQEASAALFQARRLKQVMALSEKIQTMNPEEVALWFEGMLHDVTDKLSAPDVRDESITMQVEGILSSIGALREERQHLADEVKSQEKRIVALEGLTREEKMARERMAEGEKTAKEHLAAERRLQALYTEVRNLFGATEAEVYKQGNYLVIRLRAINFPVGQAIIMPSNYALLSRVQEAIRAFKKPEVVIEGHTDSSGSDTKNQKLSQERAEAVREYLIANGTVPSDQIVAVGYGSTRPLASNATAEGRAINRRIDVLITPGVDTQR
jgi:OOP family OmpA-OmpF porin